MTAIYIIERAGWNQWYDDGGRWVSSRAAAREFGTEDAAAEVAAVLNSEFGDDCNDAVVVAR